MPFTVLRRLDCVLEATKPAVLVELDAKQQAGLNPEPFLLRKAGQSFYNTSPLDMKKLMGDQDHIRENLYSYVHSRRTLGGAHPCSPNRQRCDGANLLADWPLDRRR